MLTWRDLIIGSSSSSSSSSSINTIWCVMSCFNCLHFRFNWADFPTRGPWARRCLLSQCWQTGAENMRVSCMLYNNCDNNSWTWHGPLAVLRVQSSRGGTVHKLIRNFPFAVFFQVKKVQKDAEKLPMVKKFVAWWIEKHCSKHPSERIVVLFDMTDAGFANMVGNSSSFVPLLLHKPSQICIVMESSNLQTVLRNHCTVDCELSPTVFLCRTWSWSNFRSAASPRTSHHP